MAPTICVSREQPSRNITMRNAKVLLVDDDPLVRRALRMTLASAGYTVEEAWTGEDALEKVNVGGADLILLDLRMPGMGGLEACRRIRELADAPILIISILNDPGDRAQALDAGADDYLVKPFGIHEILTRMHALESISMV